jgi:hypothetical protein
MDIPRAAMLEYNRIVDNWHARGACPQYARWEHLRPDGTVAELWCDYSHLDTDMAREVFHHHRSKAAKHMLSYAARPTRKLARNIARHMAFAELARIARKLAREAEREAVLLN